MVFSKKHTFILNGAHWMIKNYVCCHIVHYTQLYFSITQKVHSNNKSLDIKSCWWDLVVVIHWPRGRLQCFINYRNILGWIVQIWFCYIATCHMYQEIFIKNCVVLLPFMILYQHRIKGFKSISRTIRFSLSNIWKTETIVKVS